MTAHEALVATKGRLINKGWCKDTLGPPQGPNCVVGAIINVSACSGAVNVLCEALDVEAIALPLWNNAAERTFDDVIALLDEVILATAPANAPEPQSLALSNSHGTGATVEHGKGASHG